IDQELVDPQSVLYRFEPDAIAIAVATADVAPALWTGSEPFAADSARAHERVQRWIAAARERSQASIVLHSFEQPAHAAAGVLDVQRSDGQRAAIASLNRALTVAAHESRSVYVLDYDALVARHGRSAWRDPHKDLSMRVPMNAEAFGHLADEYMRFLRPL